MLQRDFALYFYRCVKNVFFKTVKHFRNIVPCRFVQTATANHCNTISQYSSADVHKQLLQNTA